MLSVDQRNTSSCLLPSYQKQPPWSQRPGIELVRWNTISFSRGHHWGVQASLSCRTSITKGLDAPMGLSCNSVSISCQIAPRAYIDRSGSGYVPSGDDCLAKLLYMMPRLQFIFLVNPDSMPQCKLKKLGIPHYSDITPNCFC